MGRTDPWLGARMRADAQLRRGEHRLHAAIVTAMTIWLDTARALILGQQLPDNAAALLADGNTPHPDLDAAQASFGVWARALEQHVEPVLAEAFGEAFAQNQRTADISVVHWQELAMATVVDRLKIWPEGAFEELRPELLEAMANNEDIDQVQDRIGRILGIDAPARRIRADISAIDRKIADPTTPPAQLPILKGKRRELWNQHDERNLEWQWLARRIARTEIQAAMEAGALAAAQASEEITGDKMYKRWLSTHDERTRLSHSVADGQMVRLAEPFIVGGTPVQHPADPAGAARETINCRCTLAILDWNEMQAELQGMWGGRGVGPMNARLGPDDEADVAAAIDRLKREQNGEVVDDAPAAVNVAAQDDAETLGRKFEEDKHPRSKDGKWGRKTGPSQPDGDGKTDADAPKGDEKKSAPPNPAKPDETPAEDAAAAAAPILPQGIVIDDVAPGGDPEPASTWVSVDELRAADLVAPDDDPDRHFNEFEKVTAERLRALGLDLVSVKERVGKGEKTPDSIAVVAGETVELKYTTAATENAITVQIRRGAKQSSRIVVDAVDAPGMTAEVAIAAIRSNVRVRGARLAEIAVLISAANANSADTEEAAVVSWANG
ncbi:phage minor head protein [Rhodococcus sp. NPDC055112]